MPAQKIIIDTDPGIDDILTLLLILSAKPEEVQLELITLCQGNIEVNCSLRNVVSMFHILERELQWRREQGRPEGFGVLKNSRPVIAVGAKEPLEEQKVMQDYFHGKDGLGEIHTTHSHLSPKESWDHLFEPKPDLEGVKPVTKENGPEAFIPSRRPAHEEILRVLRENDPETVTIIAVAPLTNMALAAAEDPETFLRAKEIIVMTGTIEEPGNVTPMSEFNTHGDAIAAARIFALTSPLPHTTLPPKTDKSLPPYPRPLSKQLNLQLFSLDITNKHCVTRGEFNSIITPLLQKGSPLAEWVSAFMTYSFRTVEGQFVGQNGDTVELGLHDPICAYFALTRSHSGWKYASEKPEDIRVDSTGQWTRGMLVTDRRDRVREEGPHEEETPEDQGLWLNTRAGNRIWRMIESPVGKQLGQVLLKQVFS